MDKRELLDLLQAVQNGAIAPEHAAEQLSIAPFEELGYAKVDHHRSLRQGIAEVIFGQSKTFDQIAGIVDAMRKRGTRDILVTRIGADIADKLTERFPMEYHAAARLGVVDRMMGKPLKGSIAVVSAGTSDMPVAEESALTAEILGSHVTRVYDAGVAGLHRLLAHLPELQSARAVVAVAGMEGALASVVGGLVSCPVIAVPTSVGYGASFGGVAALLSMLNSCASGVSVVNIDNGFGAGYLAHIINSMEGAQ